MSRRPEWQVEKAALVCIAVIAALLCTAEVSAQDNSRIAFVAQLDPDSLSDTVFCIYPSRHVALLDRIVWGRSARDSQLVTRFKYPDWKRLKSSVAVLRVTKDTLFDLLLAYWGTDTTGNHDLDTSRLLTIPGQPALKARRTVNLASIARRQRLPFLVVDLARGTDLVEPACRDLSRRPSRRLVKLDTKLIDTSEGEGPVAELASSRDLSSPNLTVLPNPASEMMRIRVSGLVDRSDYVLELHAPDGAVVRRERIERASTDIVKAWSVNGLASGEYALRLIAARTVVASAWVTIIH